MAESDGTCGCGEAKPEANESCCCGPAVKKDIKYISVSSCCCGVETPAGKVPYVGHEWSMADHAGEIMVRFGFKRMEYALAPGLFAFGEPDANSPVLVSANYKLSFDVLRREIRDLNAWILVIDTRGVNVWCSAGKGTFCAEEIAKQVKASGLEKIVTHRNLILPQLSAPGVAANKLRELSGFRGIFGPVEARDVKKFIANGMKTEKYMREVQFGLLRRIETSWLEISTAFVPAVIASAALFAVSGWSNKGFSFEKAAGTGGIYILGILFALFAGTIIFSAVLPYIRSRYFSAKGAMLGALSAVILLALASAKAGSVNVLAVIALVSGAASISSFLALNYTGSTTFTSISGAKQEVKFSMPLIIAGLAISSIMAAADIILRSIK